jgi:Flp pilus assembly protein TadB
MGEQPAVEREIGVLTGRVDEMGRRLESVDQSFIEMRHENAEDHAVVVQRLERIDNRIASVAEFKADRTDVEDLKRHIAEREHQEESDAKTARREHRKDLISVALGLLAFVGVVIGCMVTLLAAGVIR